MTLVRPTSFLGLAVAFFAAVSLSACGPAGRGGGGDNGGSTDTTGGTTGGDTGGTTGGDTGGTTGGDTGGTTGGDTGGTTGGDTGGTQGCGQVTATGDCQGDTAEWCDDSSGTDELATFDCSADIQDDAAGAVAGHCADLGNGFGAWCSVPSGSPCSITDSQGTYYVGCGASGTDPGLACDLVDGCTATSVSCEAPADGSSFNAFCDGDHLVFDCLSWNQPLEFDCAAPDVGGSCSDATCTNIPAGGPCDGAQLLCASGLTCQGASDTTLGTCQ